MNTQPARGMRDFLPAEVRRREYVIGVIKEVYERYGFEPLETPAVENIETLMGKYGEEGNQLIFKILKRGVHEKSGEADLALRYDLTVPLARVVAQYKNELPKFFKRYQIQPVWRADRPGRGRYREFYQCDLDVLDSRSMVVEAELCAAVTDALTKLGFRDFLIRLNHRGTIDGMMELAMIEKDMRNSALLTIDKLDKIGTEGVKRELSKCGIAERSADTILHLLTNTTFWDDRQQGLSLIELSKDRYIANCQILEGVTKYVKGFDYEGEGVTSFTNGVNELQEIVDLTEKLSCRNHIKIDMSLVRGLSYYTGPIMEIHVDGIGSLGGGGRYDNLVGMFSGHAVPACGFSLGLERIIVLMTENEMFPPDLVSASADVMVAIWYQKGPEEKTHAAADSLLLARELRADGIRVDVYPLRNSKIPIQIAYASNRNIPFVVVVGPEEKELGTVKLRDMRSRVERPLARSEVAKILLEEIRKT
jgi:histidyl-tRNA synthetase